MAIQLACPCARAGRSVIDDVAAAVARYSWYHSIDLPGGVETLGWFDHRGRENNYLLPEDLRGMRCLDVGTMDGFWAFAMERRGAAEVVAIDVEDPEALDWPASKRHEVIKTLDETKRARFELVAQALDSKVTRLDLSVLDLARAVSDVGQFDLIFCGDLLLHLKDPITALESMHRACRGSTIVCNPIQHFRFNRRPLAELDGIDQFRWWIPNQAGLERMALAAGFARVESGKSFLLPLRSGATKHDRRGIIRAFV